MTNNYGTKPETPSDHRQYRKYHQPSTIPAIHSREQPVNTCELVVAEVQFLQSGKITQLGRNNTCDTIAGTRHIK